MFYAFTLVYFKLYSADFIERGRIETIVSGKPYRLGQPIALGKRPYFYSGWSNAELIGTQTGVWSNGSRAGVAVSIGKRPDRDLRLSVKGIAGPVARGKQQTIGVSVNGTTIDTWHYKQGQGIVERTARIPKELVLDNGLVRIDFTFCCARAPSGSRDLRKLGIFVLDFRILGGSPKNAKGATEDAND